MAAASRNSLGFLLLGILACARTSLRPGSDDADGVGGAPAEAGKAGSSGASSGGRGGGVASTGGKASGGTVASGGSPGSAGTFASAGVPSEAGAAGEPPVRCGSDPIALVGVTPPNADVSAPRAGIVKARFECLYDRALATPKHARLLGELSGDAPTAFPEPTSGDELWLAPRAFFAGETVTGWLGPELGGPFQWQLTAKTSPSSPGKFVAGTQDFSALPRASRMTSGDVDGDGDIDIVIARLDAMLLLSNRGDGTFADAVPLPGAGYPVLLGDVDRDGDLDMASGEAVHLNDGTGQFPTSTPAEGCVTFGDVDGDGDLDCLANTGWKGTDLFGHVLFNEKGLFVAGPPTSFGFECRVADFDGDGDVDATCVSPVVEGARVFLNDAHGLFTETQKNLGQAGARGVTVGDLDRDGDVDIVLTHWYGAGKYAPNEIWQNDGHGHFAQNGTLGSDGIELVLGDIDGDGDLDALSSVAGPSLYSDFNRARVYLNDGAGKFSVGGELGEPAFHWFELADFDGDQDLDAFVYNQMGSTKFSSSLWQNQE